MTPYGIRRGVLVVGNYGMPEIEVQHPDGSEWPDDYYTPGSFPAAWGPITGASDERIDGPLLKAWREIERIQRQLAVAQREAEVEEQHD